MDDAIRKAESLIEAGGYIRQFRDRLTVIKLGGSAMEDPAALEATLQDVVFMETVGLRPILVHGGGKAIDRAMAAAGLEPRKIQGRRVTDDAALEIVVRVLTQESEGLVEQIRLLGGQALPLFDRSLQCLFGERLTLPGRGRPAHRPRPRRPGDARGRAAVGIAGPGRRGAGDPVAGADEATAAGSTSTPTPPPPPSPRTCGPKSSSFSATRPASCSTAAIRPRSRRSLNASRCRQLIADGVIDAGMIPKVEACLDSLRGGVRKTHMIDGRLKHSLLLEIYTHSGVGTEIALE